MFEDWLDIREVVRVDSANCEHSLRSHYLQVIAQWTLQNDITLIHQINKFVRWQASRRIRGLSALRIQKFSNAYRINCAQSAEDLCDVPTITIYTASVSDGLSNWLTPVIRTDQNLRSVSALGLTLDDFEWTRALGTCSALSFVSLAFLKQQYSMPQSVLHYYAHCKHLKVVRLLGYSCVGIQSILNKNNSLVDLSLDRCESMTDATFTHILSLPLIEVIELANNNTVHGNGALHITTTALHTLHLTSFSKITQDRVLQILEAFPNKQILSVKLTTMSKITSLAYSDILKLNKRFKSMAVKFLP